MLWYNFLEFVIIIQFKVIFMVSPQKNVESIKKPRPEFLILGGGIIGFAVAKELRKTEKEITVIDIDKSRVETLRQEGFNALIGDIADSELYNVIDSRNLICVAVLSSNDDANIKAVTNFKSTDRKSVV